MYKIDNILNSPNIKQRDNVGAFKVIEHINNLSPPGTPSDEYVRRKLDVHLHQVICDLNYSPVVIQAEKFLWSVGEIVISKEGNAITELFKKNSGTKENVERPEFNGEGFIMLAPTERHVLIMSMSDWKEQLTVDEGVFCACEAGIKQKSTSRAGLSSVVGAKGSNLALVGKGNVCLEIPCEEKDLACVVLEKDVFKIQSGKALMWSSTLNFSVEQYPGGTVDVFRGSGKIMFI